jgi:hypothetical protein
MTRYRARSLALGAALLALALWASMQPWGLRWDFAQVYDTGHRVSVGEFDNLYRSTSAIAGRPPLGVMRFWGAPAAGLLYAPLTWLDPESALRVFKLQNVAVYLIALVLLVRVYLGPIRRAPGPQERDLFAFLCLLVFFQPFWTVFLVGGQTTPTVFLGLVVFTIAFLRNRVAIAALSLTVIFLVKPAFVLMLVMFAIALQWRLLAYTLLWLGAAGLASLAVFGWGPNLTFLANATQGLDATRLWTYNSSIPALVHNFRLLGTGDAARPAPGWIAPVAAVVRVATVAVFAVLWIHARRAGMTAAGTRNYVALMSLAFFLLVSETVWEHYVMVLFIPATYVLARRALFPAGAVRVMLGAVVLSAAQNLYLALTIERLLRIDSIPEIIAVGLYKSGPLLLLGWFLIRYHGEFVKSQPAAI